MTACGATQDTVCAGASVCCLRFKLPALLWSPVHHLHHGARVRCVFGADKVGRLSLVLATLTTQLGQASMESDLSAVNVAYAYKSDINLRTFPVPRFALADALVYMNVSVASQSISDADKAAAFLHVRAAPCCVRAVSACCCAPISFVCNSKALVSPVAPAAIVIARCRSWAAQWLTSRSRKTCRPHPSRR